MFGRAMLIKMQESREARKAETVKNEQSELLARFGRDAQWNEQIAQQNHQEALRAAEQANQIFQQQHQLMNDMFHHHHF